MSGLDLRAAVSTDEVGALVISLAGDVDMVSADSVVECVTSALHAGERRIVLDVAGVTFLDSSGLTAFVVALNEANTLGGTVTLRSVGRRTLDLLVMTGLDGVFRIEH